MKDEQLSDETKQLLKKVVDHFEKEDQAVRIMKIRQIRRLKLYWNNISHIYWSDVARDYRIHSSETSSDNDQAYYDRPVNVFKAFLETIIAAISIQIPAISCSPDDADNPLDLSTAKAGDKIAELLYKHNDAVYLFVHALYIYVTEGMVASYQYDKADKSYGMYKQNKYKEEKIEAYACPHCAARLEDAYVESMNTGNPEIMMREEQIIEDESENIRLEEESEFGPDDNDIDLHAELNSNKLVCPECAQELDPNLQKSSLVVPRFVGVSNTPKSRICFDLFGELYIKIASYARKQEDTPYLIWAYETHYANVLEKYGKDDEELWNKLPKGSNTPASSDPYEQSARINPQYRSEFPEEQVTVRNAWLRPSAFNVLSREESDQLHKDYPDGCKVVIAQDFVVEACNESLDDCWTITKNPQSDFLTFDPLGELLVNIQDIINDLISLTLQTIEHGIPQTWADPAVVNFDQYAQVEAMPGTLTPTKPMGGTKNIGEAFFASKASALSPEIFQFYQIINQLGQFVSAAMPSIWGGTETNSSRTASEYAMSRTASLQRLQTPWRMFAIWWKETFGKAIPAYIKLVQEDERFVKKDPNGNFVNIWIRRADLQGKIGNVELEASDTMPISDEQKAEIIMRIMELNNEMLLSAMFSPDNLPFIRKIIKIPEFVIPGEEDRQKQYEEIQQLVETEPIVTEPNLEMIELAMAQGMPPEPIEEPSIMPDLLVDNHMIEAEICRTWLVGEAGRLAKVENPAGYKNVLLHMKAHMDIIAMQQAQQAQMQQDNADSQNSKSNSPPKKPKGDSQVKGVDDVRTPVQ